MNEGIEDDSSRRKFIRVATLSASAACGIFPIAAGVPALLDPVKKSSAGAGKVPWSKVALLASLPEDGSPAKFEVVQEKVVDAWTTYKDVPVGAVYLTRKNNEVVAFNLNAHTWVVPLIIESKATTIFVQHNSSFALDGSVTTEIVPVHDPWIQWKQK